MSGFGYAGAGGKGARAVLEAQLAALVERAARTLDYLDPTQANRIVDHPYPSARSVILYSGERFDESGHDLAVGHQGTDLFINRHTADLIVSD